MPHVSRFKRRNSDRSGFRYYEYELVKDLPWKVGIDEFDTPPPSKRSLGGEGDVSGDIRASGNFGDAGTLETPTGLDNPIVFITAAGGVSPSFVHPFMRISGSNATVDITANPQVVAGQEGQLLTLICVDSSVTFDHGTGLSLMGSSRFVMSSGAIMTLWYSTSNSVWNETSRIPGR